MKKISGLVLFISLFIWMFGAFASATQYETTGYNWDRWFGCGKDGTTVKVRYNPTTHSLGQVYINAVTTHYQYTPICNPSITTGLKYTGKYKMSSNNMTNFEIPANQADNYSVPSTITNLSSATPDTKYTLSLEMDAFWCWTNVEDGPYYWRNYEYDWVVVNAATGQKAPQVYNIELYTNPVIPNSFTTPTINETSINIRWSNDDNPTTTSYTLYRKVSSSGTWVALTTANNLTQFTDTGLTGGTSYDYKVRVNAASGRTYDSAITTVTTTTNPAVAAAQAAKIAAESAAASAGTAATKATIASDAATNAATQATTAATNTIFNGQSAAYWAYQAAQSAQITPAINVIGGTDILEGVLGEFGNAAGLLDTTGLGIKATTVAGSGYTEITGKLNLSAGKTREIKKVVVGGRTFLFKIIAQPTLNDVATVTFN